MSEPCNLEPGALERLHRLGGPKFTAKMVDLFLSYVAEKITEARAALTAGDLTGVANAVHPIKSSAANIGANRLQDLATRLEVLATQGQGDTLPALVTELEQSFAAVRPELEEKRKSPLCQSP